MLRVRSTVRRCLKAVRTAMCAKGQLVLSAELRVADGTKPEEDLEVDRIGPDARQTPPPTSGLVEWLRSCPDHDWFVDIESESTVGRDAAWQETADLFRSPANARRLLDAAEPAERGETDERRLNRG
jgi:hypothetical protein